jgi:hypothetical protein
MPTLTLRIASLALLCGAAALPALAASSASSASSDGSSASVGSISTSFEKSSDSSSKGDKVAEGDYRVIDMAAVAGKPDMVRLKLQAVAERGADGELVLLLPQAAVDQGGIATGQVVSAKRRPYGIEFTSAATQQAFFLVLRDAWYDELHTRPVTL